VFQEPHFKVAGSRAPEELLWILGKQGVRDYMSLPDAEPAPSQAFPDAGTYVLRDKISICFSTRAAPESTAAARTATTMRSRSKSLPAERRS